MWVFISDSFLSIVEHRGDPDNLLVRARAPGDIERVFPGTAVVEGAGTDYRFRTVVARDAVAQAMARQVYEIDYTNFKDSVGESARHQSYFGVWSVMNDYQDRMDPARRGRLFPEIGVEDDDEEAYFPAMNYPF